MKHWGALMLALAITAGLAMLLVRGVPAAHRDGRVYAVAELQADMATHPAAWLGRTVLVTGTLSGGAIFSPCSISMTCPPLIPTTTLLPPYNDDSATPMILEPDSGNPLESLVRRVPFLGAMLPPLQRLDWKRPAVYRVRLEAQPARYKPYALCGKVPCAAAVLVDAVQSDFGE